MLAFVAEALRREALLENVQHLLEHLARGLDIDVVVIELEGRHAAPDADVEAAVRQMVEHRDFLDQAERGIERQQIGERPEADGLGHLRDGGEIDARHRDHVERRRMVLGHVIGGEAQLVGERHIFEALVELPGQREVVAVDVVEQAEFHSLSPRRFRAS